MSEIDRTAASQSFQDSLHQLEETLDQDDLQALNPQAGEPSAGSSDPPVQSIPDHHHHHREEQLAAMAAAIADLEAFLKSGKEDGEATLP